MIIVRLRGGLGNQLFQYACGKALSIESGNSLKLDISGYIRQNNSDTPRTYSLSFFSIEDAIATPEEIHKLKYPFGIISKGWRFAKAKIFRQFNIGFYPNLLAKASRKKDFYLDGFWQSERYFKKIEAVLREKFKLKKGLGSAAAAIADQLNADSINNISTVSLHIRRGDIAQAGKSNAYFGICTPSYYAAAFNHMRTCLQNIRIFVFSDDPAWVKDNIHIPFPATFVSDGKRPDTIPDHEELILMSMCHHHIIANSTFSWWGAWLNPRQDKIVIAPKEWAMRGKKHHIDTVPPSWIRL